MNTTISNGAVMNMCNDFFLNHLTITNLNFVHTYIATSDKYPIINRGRFHHGFIYTINGTETYHFKDLIIEATPGSVLYIPKGENYKIILTGEKSTVIAVDFEISGESSRPFCTNFSETNAIRSCFMDMEMKWKRRNSNYIPECKSYFYKIVGILSKQASSTFPASKFDVIEDGVKYLRENYLKNDFSIEDLSEMTRISRRYFETLFRLRYNTTPKAYIISLKIETAKELLLNEKLLIKDIALMLGYSDIYHFGKIFKAKTGYTPSEYKSSHGH